MSEKMHFEIMIQAPIQKVWDTMLNKESYEKWTTIFDPNSSYEGSWEKGSKMTFLGTAGFGMVSEIAENIPYQYISIKHVGEIRDGVLVTTEEDALNWDKEYENYTFTDKGGETYLEVDLEMEASLTTPEMKQLLQEMWPQALLKLKEICEK